MIAFAIPRAIIVKVSPNSYITFTLTNFVKSAIIHGLHHLSVPASVYLLKVNNRNTRTRCEICSKLTIKTPERRHWRRYSVFIVNFEHISHLVLVLLLLTLNKQMPAEVSFVQRTFTWYFLLVSDRTSSIC